MNSLPLNLKQDKSGNRLAVTKPLGATQSNKARLVHLDHGIFFNSNVVVEYQGNPLIEGTDYLVTGYSKHLKHNYQVDGSGFIAILNDSLPEGADITATVDFVGGLYCYYETYNLPKHVTRVGGGVVQLLWDNVTTGYFVDDRALTGIYDPSPRTELSSILNLLDVMAEDGKTDGLPEDKQALRDIISTASLGKLAIIPGGLETNNDKIPGAINELKEQGDVLLKRTYFLGAPTNDIDLSAFTSNNRCGWVIAKDGVTVTADFGDGVEQKTLNLYDAVLFSPQTNKFSVDTDNTDTDLMYTPLFDSARPSGIMSQANNNDLLKGWNTSLFRLLNWSAVFGGFVSTARGVLPLTTAQITPTLQIIAEAGTYSYYNGTVVVDRAFNLGEIIYHEPNGSVSVLSGFRTGGYLRYDSAIDVVNEINKTDEKAAVLDRRGLGEIVMTYADLTTREELTALGGTMDRSEPLFAELGTLYGEGDGSTTFDLPNVPNDIGPYSTHTAVVRHDQPVSTRIVAGLDIDHMFLYGAGAGLQRMSLDDGSLDPIGSYTNVIAAITDLDANLVYAYDATTKTLFSYNGVGVSIIRVYSSDNPEALGVGGGQLFMIGDEKVYSVDKLSGVLTEIGAVPGTFTTISMAYSLPDNALIIVTDAVAGKLTLDNGQYVADSTFDLNGNGNIVARTDGKIYLYDPVSGRMRVYDPATSTMLVVTRILPGATWVAPSIDVPARFHVSRMGLALRVTYQPAPTYAIVSKTLRG